MTTIFRRTILLLLLIFSSIAQHVPAQTVDNLILMSEEFPPYNFVQDGKLEGISIDLMTLCLEKLGSQLGRKDIRILPWARAYKMVLEEDNTVLFAMTRTPQREHLFKWVGPISSSKNVLFARKSLHIRIDKAGNIAKYRIGVIRDDAGEQLVLSEFNLEESDLNLTSSALSSIFQLESGRIDIFAYDENVTKWIMNQQGIDSSKYEKIYTLSEGFHYFGFNRNTPDSLINEFQNALNELKADGSYDAVLARYR